MKVSELVGKKVIVYFYDGLSQKLIIQYVSVFGGRLHLHFKATNYKKEEGLNLCSKTVIDTYEIKNIPNVLTIRLEKEMANEREVLFGINCKDGVSEDNVGREIKGIEFQHEDFAEYFAAKEAEEKEREKGLWFESKMRGFTVDFYKPLKEMQEELKSYYLAAVKDIIEKDKLMISNDTIKDAIKNGLVIKYPELKKVLVGDKKDKIEVEAPVLKNDAEIKKVLKKAGLEKRNYDNFDIAIPLQVFVYEYNEDVDYIHKLKKLLKDVEFKPSPLFKYSEEEFEGDSNMEEVYEALKDYYIKK